jgi:mono/diheme cytochrome c family protein
MTILLAATTQQTLGVAVVVILLLGWFGYIVTHLNRSPEPPGAEIELAPNRKPYLDDDELEGPKLSKSVTWSFVLLAITAIGLPLYWAREPGRQAGAERGFDSRAVKRGWSLFQPTDSPEHGAHFGCATCHGPNGEGGTTLYTMTDYLGRTRQVEWAVPALDTVRLRFDREETRRVIVYGRPQTPMPAWGTEGGGPLNDQQVDDLVAYIESIQLNSRDAKARAAQGPQDGASLFANFCARCHTKGFSYGEPDVMGGGAFGPSLVGGSTLRQFPDVASMIEFITNGSEFEKEYGERGIGSGRMPGFGDRTDEDEPVHGELTPEQIRAIVEYERGL